MSKVKTDLAMYAALFYGKEPGTGRPSSLKEIGNIMGVTRERVRQIRSKHFPHLGSIKFETKTFYEKKKKKERFESLWAFRLMVRKWLLAEGYKQCCTCKLVKCLEEMSAAKCETSGRCLVCLASRNKERYHTDPSYKEKQREWKEKNKDKCSFYDKKYYLKSGAELDRKRAELGSPSFLKCSLCSRIMNRKPWCPKFLRKHLTLQGEKCQGYKYPGIEIVKGA